ncbi:ribosomal biogenesis Gar2 protein [Rutstroemia sp. NJR-2017a BBW]|nr:ribosomal biogenesis Gar2 protein [Rutstroemia sp. NJR-2017a BBW]
MAKEAQIQKKRKAASAAPADEVAKLKKVKKLEAEVKKLPEKKRKAAEEVAPEAVKKTKTPKSSKDVAATEKALKTVKANVQKKPKSKKTKEPEPEPEPESSEDEEEAVDDSAVAEAQDDEDDEDEEEDDQTQALLKGFESDSDEEENAKEGGFEEGQPIPNALEKLSKKEKKAIRKAAEKAADEKPGVVYIGRIPHGFYENEMKAYFSQFGNILKIRMSRNRKTGASKHYAWIQFESKGVAEIVAKTMDNYLLFNHILKVKLVADEQISPDLFKGANRRFKKVPWNKIEGRKLEQGASEDQWEKRRAKEEKRRAKKLEKLQAMDYEFDAPQIKSAKGVAKKPVAKITENGEADEETAAVEEEPKAIEAPPAPVVEEPVKKKKVKKTKVVEELPGATLVAETTVTTEEVVEKPKEKKSKNAGEYQMQMHVERVPGEPVVEHDFAADEGFEREGGEHVKAETETREIDEGVGGGEVVEDVAEGEGAEGEEAGEGHEEAGEHGYAGAVVGDAGEAVDGGGLEGAVD